jgi:hypothetical protein
MSDKYIWLADDPQYVAVMNAETMPPEHEPEPDNNFEVLRRRSWERILWERLLWVLVAQFIFNGVLLWHILVKKN